MGIARRIYFSLIKVSHQHYTVPTGKTILNSQIIFRKIPGGHSHYIFWLPLADTFRTALFSSMKELGFSDLDMSGFLEKNGVGFLTLLVDYDIINRVIIDSKLNKVHEKR